MKKIYEERINKVLNEMHSKNFESVMFHKNWDILYLTEFKDKHNNATIIINDNLRIFITDGRFINQFNNEVEDFDLYVLNNKNSRFQEINKILKENNIEKIMIPYNDITYQNSIDLKINDYQTQDSSYITTKLRRKKDEEEIEITKQACKITEDSFLAIINKIKEGMSEKEIRDMLEEEMKSRGAEGLSFPTIVASGSNNGASPHAKPTDRKIKKGDFVTIDFGAVYKNYKADITRTIAIGEISEEKLEVYNTVLKAKNESVKMLKAGVRAQDVHKKAESIINEFGQEFLHGLGHGIGIDEHEAPTLNKTSEEILDVNDIHSIEPGIYIPGLCGVRIEDDYRITEDGYECLTPNITTELITIN